MSADYNPPINFLAQLGIIVLLGGFFIIIQTSQAYSESRQCRLLRSELKTLSTSSGKNGKADHFNALYSRQLKAIKYARRDALALRCVHRSGTRRADGAASCPALLSKINKMQRNLSRLERRQNSAAVLDKKQDRQIKRRQRAIRTKLQRLRCGQRPTITSASISKKNEIKGLRTKKRRGFLSRLLGLNTRQGRYGNRGAIIEPERPIEPTYGNVFRTLCVRINDGYYYPISFATVRSAFDTDEAICLSGNKDTEVRLFVYRNPSETVEEMRDLSGQLYIDLPNAFRYRNELVKENFQTKKSKNFTIIAGKGYTIPQNGKAPNYGEVYANYENEPPRPIKKPDFYSDPDTKMAKQGGFELIPVREQDLKEVVAQQTTTSYNPDAIEQAGIRVIGPTFLADQQSAKLLLAPDQIQLQ